MVNRMRVLALVALSMNAFAQTPLIGVNSATAELPAGARDVIVPITLDPSPGGGDMLAIMLATEGVKIRIELPDGSAITKDDGIAHGFTWEVAAQGQGDELMFPGLQGKENNVLFLPPNAPACKYKIHADASALKEESVIIVQFLPLGKEPADSNGRDTVRVALTAPETFHYAGDKVQLLAGVFEGDRGIANATLTSAAVRVDESGMPQGNPMPVKFQPSGPAGDGSYTAELPASAAGDYEVSLQVRGHYASGEEFERVAATSIKIDIRRATILSVTEKPADEDGNGLIDRIDVTARVKVELAGKYDLQIDLHAANGKYMQAHGKAELGVGESTITARVDRYSLVHIGADGPYKMSARLWRQETNTDGFASLLEDAGVTRPYQQSSFDHGPIYFADNAKAIPQSASGKAPFNKLAVTFDIFTPGGFCYWTSRLMSERAEVGDAQKNGSLPKGPSQVTLIFDGYPISDAADGKALTLYDTAITCGALHAVPEHPIAIRFFPAGTFAKEPPGFEISSEPSFGLKDYFRIQRGKSVGMSIWIRPKGGFNETVELAIDPLPSGVIIERFPRSAPARSFPGSIPYQLTAAPGAALGEFKITFRARYKTMQRTAQLNLFVDP